MTFLHQFFPSKIPDPLPISKAKESQTEELIDLILRAKEPYTWTSEGNRQFDELLKTVRKTAGDEFFRSLRAGRSNYISHMLRLEFLDSLVRVT